MQLQSEETNEAQRGEGLETHVYGPNLGLNSSHQEEGMGKGKGIDGTQYCSKKVRINPVPGLGYSTKSPYPAIQMEPGGVGRLEESALKVSAKDRESFWLGQKNSV